MHPGSEQNARETACEAAGEDNKVNDATVNIIMAATMSIINDDGGDSGGNSFILSLCFVFAFFLVCKL
jgi:hypothetical protein